MFARKLTVRYTAGAEEKPVPLLWLDSFAMRNFTNHACFDDLLPVSDGLLEAGFAVPLEELEAAMTAWFRRKGRLVGEDTVKVEETAKPNPCAS